MFNITSRGYFHQHTGWDNNLSSTTALFLNNWPGLDYGETGGVGKSLSPSLFFPSLFDLCTALPCWHCMWAELKIPSVTTKMNASLPLFLPLSLLLTLLLTHPPLAPAASFRFPAVFTQSCSLWDHNALWPSACIHPSLQANVCTTKSHRCSTNMLKQCWTKQPCPLTYDLESLISSCSNQLRSDLDTLKQLNRCG